MTRPPRGARLTEGGRAVGPPASGNPNPAPPRRTGEVGARHLLFPLALLAYTRGPASPRRPKDPTLPVTGGTNPNLLATGPADGRRGKRRARDSRKSAEGGRDRTSPTGEQRATPESLNLRARTR